MTRKLDPTEIVFLALFALLLFLLGGAVGSVFTPDAQETTTTVTVPAEAKVVFRVDSLGTDGKPGNTTVTYSPDGKTNVSVGEIGDTFSVELNDNALASLTFTNGEGTLATAYAYRQGVTVDEQTVGPNSYQQVKN